MKLEKLRILVVDDHADTQKTMCLMLRQLGVEKILTANDGQEALDIIDGEGTEGIHVVLCDWNMPNVSGIEFLRQVRSIDHALPFVMVTARGDANSVEEARDAKVTGYILKPFTLGELKKKMEMLVETAVGKG
ncbi:MAG: response regulator [Alphaproteobacteria bacterium]|nr:response regulator [Alphaproteobacteria bacterium]